MKKTNRKKNETGWLKELLKKYIELALEMEGTEKIIYRIIKKHLQIYPEESSQTSWLFIEGIIITEKEKAAIKSILKKRDYKFQKAA